MHLIHEMVTDTAIYIPDIEQVRIRHDAIGAFPFWAKIWESSIAMGLLLQERPELVAGRTVLELAAGLGLPSVIAAKHAVNVICSDAFPEALEFVAATAKYHQLHNIEHRVIDFRDIPTGLKFDIVLLSDVNYDGALLKELHRSIMSLLERNISILLATPERIVARGFIGSLLPYCLEQMEKKVADTYVQLYLL